MDKLCFQVQQTLKGYEGDDWKTHVDQILDCSLRDNLSAYHPQFGYGKTWLNGKGDNFMLGVYGWHPNAATPCHEHGGYTHAFYHTLKGQFTNEVYQIEGSYPYELVPSRKEVLLPGQTGYLSPDEAHVVRNAGDEVGCTIHCYFSLFEEHLEFQDGVSVKSTEQTSSRGASKLPTFFDLRCVRILCDDLDRKTAVYKKFYHCFSDVNGNLSNGQISIIFQNLNILSNGKINAHYNKNGNVSEKDFVDILMNTLPDQAEVKALFEVIDRDSSGTIALDELQFAIRGATLDQDICANALLWEIDADDSKCISLHELTAFALKSNSSPPSANWMTSQF